MTQFLPEFLWGALNIYFIGAEFEESVSRNADAKDHQAAIDSVYGRWETEGKPIPVQVKII